MIVPIYIIYIYGSYLVNTIVRPRQEGCDVSEGYLRVRRTTTTLWEINLRVALLGIL